MFAALQRQQRLMSSRLTLLAFVNAFLDPALIIATLLAVALWHGEAFDRTYFVLSLIAFSLSFPGERRVEKSLRSATLDILIGWGGILAILFFFGYATGYLILFPGPIILHWAIAAPLAMIAGHLVLRSILLRAQRTASLRKRAVIAGAGSLGVKLAREIALNPWLGIDVIGYFEDRGRERLDNVLTAPLLGRLSDLSNFARDTRLDIIYITLPMATQPRILRLLDDLRDTTVSINFVPDIFLTDLIQGRVDHVNGIPIVAVCDTPFTGMNGVIKRVSDIVLATLILLLISPLMIAIAIGVKMSSPGPILFKQRRYGLDGADILVYKFRSMTVCEDGAVIKQATRDDQRITRLGAFLRKSSLDELPQFFNVLQGRMSIVGPRPHAVAHNEIYRKLIKGYMVRHKVKPGITGWAQVNGYRGETDLLEKMQARIDYDLDYLRNWSLKLDLAIIARTVLVVVHDKHAY